MLKRVGAEEVGWPIICAIVHEIVVTEVARQGADSVILGCTELGLLTPPNTFWVPAVDTTELHCVAAMAFALGTDIQ